MDELSEKFQRWGGGVIFNPKIYVADFGPLNRTFWAWNWEKFATWFSENERVGQRPFGTFLKVHLFWWRHPSLTLENKIASRHHQIRSHSGDKRCFPSWIFSVSCVTNGNPLILWLFYTPILLPYLSWANLYVILLVSWFWIGIHGFATATSGPSENGSQFRWRSKH